MICRIMNILAEPCHTGLISILAAVIVVSTIHFIFTLPLVELIFLVQEDAAGRCPAFGLSFDEIDLASQSFRRLEWCRVV